jgi:pyruvate,orthophosphate dikinase
VKVALAESRGTPDKEAEALLRQVRQLHEQNPMLGTRGVRLGLIIPDLFQLQVQAIAEAAARLTVAGRDPRPEIMVPLIATVEELVVIRHESEKTLARVAAETGVALDIPIGTMIELPRAALTAGRIAQEADFFSFGTNDLTQTTWGFSRDDVEAAASPWASAESTGATRTRSTSSNRCRSTTCPAHRSGCRSPGSRRAGRRSCTVRG